MAVDQIRTESDDRKDGQYRLGEKCKFLNVCPKIPIRLRASKINQIVNEIISNAVQFISHHAHMRTRIV